MFKNLKLLQKYLKGFYFGFAILTLIKVIYSFLTPYSFLYLEKLIDSVSLESFNKMDACIFILINFTVVLFSFISQMLENTMEKRVGGTVACDVMKKTCRIKYETFESPDSEDVIQMLKEQPENYVLDFLKNGMDILVTAVELLGFAMIIAKASSILLILLLLMLAVTCVLDAKSMRLMNNMFKHQSRNEREVKEREQHLKNRDSLSVLRIYGYLKQYIEKYRSFVHSIRDERIHTTLVANKYSIFIYIISGGWMLGSILLTIRFFYRGDIGIGSLCILINSFVSLLSISERFSYALSMILENRFRVMQLKKFLNFEETGATGSIRELTQDDCVIEFDRVYFRYPHSETMVLKGVSFKVRAGEKISLVGRNGSGKTTILKLLLGLYTPTSGRILLLGRDIVSYTDSERAKIIAVVFQDYSKFQLSIRENVSLSCLEKKEDDASITKALDEAQLYALTDKNYDQELGKLESDALDLSGGQWQRLSIARALFTDKEILFFDEPLAAADPIQEANMYDRLQQLSVGRTSIIISHRMGSVKKSDRIIVLDGGQIVESGTHDQLIREKALYYEFYTAQSAWYKEGGDGHEEA